jgi:hypothetical protein
MGLKGCPETSVRNYHYTLHNIPAAVARPYFLQRKKEIKALPELHQVSLNQLFAKNSYTRNITHNQVSATN